MVHIQRMARPYSAAFFATLTCSVSGSEVTWRLANHGESCSESCAVAGSMTCQEGHWTLTADEVQEITHSVAFVCASHEAISQPMGPSVDDDGRCYSSSQPARVGCTARSAAGFRRLCPCGSDSVQFLMGFTGWSCSETCLRKGGQCEDSFAWPSSQAAMQQAAHEAGYACSATTGTLSDAAPFVDQGSTGMCFYTAMPSMSKCHTAVEGEKWRICPCQGAAPADPGLVVDGGLGVQSGDGSLDTPGRDYGLGGGSGWPQRNRFFDCRNGGFSIGDRIGGRQQKLTAIFLSQQECQMAVMQNCPDSNGATFSPGLGECWCNVEMTGFAPEPTLRTCWFETRPARLWSRVGLASPLAPPRELATSVGATLLGAALVLGAAAGLALRGWRRRRTSDSAQQVPLEEDE